LPDLVFGAQLSLFSLHQARASDKEARADPGIDPAPPELDGVEEDLVAAEQEALDDDVIAWTTGWLATEEGADDFVGDVARAEIVVHGCLLEVVAHLGRKFESRSHRMPTSILPSA
jgi:hypothetical protein